MEAKPKGKTGYDIRFKRIVKEVTFKLLGVDWSWKVWGVLGENFRAFSCT